MLTGLPSFTSSELTRTSIIFALAAPEGDGHLLRHGARGAFRRQSVRRGLGGSTSTQRDSAADSSRRGGESHTVFAFSTP